MIRLTVTRDAGERSVYEFDKDEILIGRSGNADVVLDNDAVSRRHSRLTRKSDGWHVSDLGTANGVFLQKQGEPPAQRVIVDALATGDVICIERFRIHFEERPGALTHKGGLVEGAALPEDFSPEEGPTDVRGLSAAERAVIRAAAAPSPASSRLDASVALSVGTPVSSLTRELPASGSTRERHLEIFEEGSSGPRRVVLGLAPVQFGSDPSCDVRLTGLTVPRFVAVLEPQPDKVILRRVSSGILGPKVTLGGETVRKAELEDGAKFFVGAVACILRLPR